MYVDKDGKRLKSSYYPHTRNYIFELSDGRKVSGRVEWNGHSGEQHGFWFVRTEPGTNLPLEVQLRFEEVLKSPKVLRCNQLRRVK